MTAENLRRTPLHSVHEALGASFTDFGGWDMPLKYGSELAAHGAVLGRDLRPLPHGRGADPRCGCCLLYTSDAADE